MDLLTFLEDNDLDDVIKKYFSGNFDSFFNFLIKSNLLENFKDTLLDDGHFNHVMSYYYNEDPQYVIDYIIDEYFGDVKQDGNKLWLSISREDLADLFHTSPWGGGSRDVAEKVLSDDYEDFFDFVEIHNLENDVISELTPENLNTLKKRVYEEIEDKEIEIDGETDIVTLKMVMNMDDFDLSELINNNAPDVYTDLSSLYSLAYEYAYSNEIYEGVMNELKYFFGVNDFSREVPYKRKTYKKGTNEPIEVDDYMYQVDVTNILPEVIKTVLGYEGYNSGNDFEYYGDFESLLKFYLGEEGYLDFTFSDYADSRKVTENINFSFNDYI